MRASISINYFGRTTMLYLTQSTLFVVKFQILETSHPDVTHKCHCVGRVGVLLSKNKKEGRTGRSRGCSPLPVKQWPIVNCEFVQQSISMHVAKSNQCMYRSIHIPHYTEYGPTLLLIRESMTYGKR